MTEVEKIKEYIEKHSDELNYEIYQDIGFAKDVLCEIEIIVVRHDSLNRPVYDDRLTVYHRENGIVKVLFQVWEHGFKRPTKSTLKKMVAKLTCSGCNTIVCYYWRIRTSDRGKEQFVLSLLTIEDYLNAIELYKRIWAEEEDLAYTTYLIEQLTLPLEDKIHSEHLTKEEFLDRRKNSNKDF